MNFKVHTPESAPAKAKEVLEGAKNAFGFVPNLLGIMAEAPALAKAYRMMAGLFEETSFSPTERQTILLTISADHSADDQLRKRLYLLRRRAFGHRRHATGAGGCH